MITPHHSQVVCPPTLYIYQRRLHFNLISKSNSIARIVTKHRIRNTTHPYYPNQTQFLRQIFPPDNPDMAIIKKYHPLTIWDIEETLSRDTLSSTSSLRKDSCTSQDSHPDTEGTLPGVELVVDHSSPSSSTSSPMAYKDGCGSCSSVEGQCKDLNESNVEELDKKRNAMANIHWEEQD